MDAPRTGVVAARLQAESWGEMRWLIDDDLAPGAGLSLAEMTLRPGATSPSHRHANCSETVHLREGTVEQAIGDRRILLNLGDTVMIGPGEVHFTRNPGTVPARMTIAYSTGRRHYEPA